MVFFGILRSDGTKIDPELLRRVSDVLRFRGPDGENISTTAGIGTCFSFLATGPVLQSEQQPVTLGHDWVIGDIRLDAQQRLLKGLRSKGVHLANDLTSEELLLQSWKIWGSSGLENLLGDFAFALWEQDRRSLWCARDFVGARPFYYAHREGLFCFSNTLAALRVVPEVSSKLDETFVGEFLLRGYSSDLSRTVYAEVKRLPAGHLLQYKDGTIHVTRFLTLPIEEPLRFSKPEEYLDAYRDVLRDAVRDRLQSE